jgi:hypothetical protein
VVTTNSARRTARHRLVIASLLTVVVVASLQTVAWADARLADPVLANQASPSGFPAGVSIYDSATLGQGDNPTGTITFRLFGPSDPTCSGAPLFTSTTSVAGNAYYTSGYFPAAVAGTYRWIASYSGDADNNPASSRCDDAGAAVMVGKRTPTLNAAASPVSGTGTITNTATLANGAGGSGPTGTLKFSLYGPNNLTCAGTPIFTSTSAVAGTGTHTSNSFTPTAPGSYQWVVSYGGDTNNFGAATICSDPANAVTVGASSTSPRLTVTPASVARGTQLTISWSDVTATPTDWLALYTAGAPNWSVVAWKYTGGSASGSVKVTVPWSAAPGTYEVRLFAQASYTRLATSSPITVS